MTWLEACDIAHHLECRAAACVCDLETGRVCSQCQCLIEMAEAVDAYAARCLMQQNREARHVVD